MGRWFQWIPDRDEEYPADGKIRWCCLELGEAAIHVAASRKTNARWIDIGRVEIRQGTVSQLPFPDDVFNLVTAVETHYFWPDLAADTREVFRVLKPGGALIMIAEAYKGAKTAAAKLNEQYLPLAGMTLLSVEEHRELFTTAGYADVQVIEEAGKG